MSIFSPQDFHFTVEDRVFIQSVCEDAGETYEEFARHAIIDTAIETNGRARV